MTSPNSVEALVSRFLDEIIIALSYHSYLRSPPHAVPAPAEALDPLSSAPCEVHLVFLECVLGEVACPCTVNMRHSG